MNQRDLSEKLELLAIRCEEIADSDDISWYLELRKVAKELRQLSVEKYAPGNSATWADVAPKPKKKYTDKQGRKLPF